MLAIVTFALSVTVCYIIMLNLLKWSRLEYEKMADFSKTVVCSQYNRELDEDWPANVPCQHAYL